MKAKIIILALIATVVRPEAVQAVSAGCPYNFENRIAYEDVADFRPAVIQIIDSLVNSPVGTGYFIDGEARILLTAHHVIAGLDRGQPRIVGQSPYINGGNKFRLKILGSMNQEGVDVALLQIDDRNFEGPLAAVDVSYWVPPLSGKLWVLGYPAIQVDIGMIDGPLQRIIEPGDALSYLSSSPKATHRLYEVRHGISEGYSGGPLLTSSGLAIGTVHKVRDGEVAYYEPLYLSADLIAEKLGEFKLPSELRLADKMVQEGSEGVKLARTLESFSARIKNLHLIVWARSLLRLTPSAASVDAIRCPIMKLMRDRYLDDLADALLTEFVARPPTLVDVYSGPEAG